MKKKKVVFLSIGAAAIVTAGLLVYTYWPGQSSTAAEVPLNTATVTKGDITVSVSGAGSVTASNTAKVKTKASGQVLKVLVKAGDTVKKGQTLITFSGEDLSANLKQEKNNLANMKLDLEDKQDQYDKLVDNGASDDQLTSAKRSLEKAQTDIDTQKDKVASVEASMVPPSPLTAPIDGTITAVNIDEGEKAMDGAELIDITDYAHLRAVVQVDELDVPSLTLGMPAKITLDALPDQAFQGKVTAIANEGTVSNGVSLFDVTVNMDTSKGARAGMSAEVNITTAEKKDVLTVPIEAVRERGGTYTVAVPLSAGAAGGNEAAGAEATGSGQAAGGSSGSEGSTRTGEAPGAGSGSARFGAGGGAGSYGGGTRSGRASGGQGGRTGTAASAQERRVTVQVGLHDETRFEITGGLKEGDQVIIPTVISTGNANASQQFQGGGFGGFGGLGGGLGSGFNGGGFGGTGGRNSGGGAGSTGGTGGAGAAGGTGGAGGTGSRGGGQ